MSADLALVVTAFGLVAVLAGGYVVLRSTSNQKSSALNRELIADQERMITFQTAERIRLQTELDQARTKLMEKVAVEELRLEVNRHEESRRQEHVRLEGMIGNHEGLLRELIAETRRRGGGSG